MNTSSFPVNSHRWMLAASIVLLAFCNQPCQAQGDGTSFSSQTQYTESGQPAITPNTRQLADPATGSSTFTGNNRQLTDPNTGQSTFKGYNIKLTDPVTGDSTFKGYGQNPLMKDRSSAPDFKWNSNVDEQGKSEYTGFGRDPLTTPDGHSTFIGNNRRLVDQSGRPSFTGNTRNLSTPQGRKQFEADQTYYRGNNVNSGSEYNEPGRVVIPYGGIDYTADPEKEEKVEMERWNPDIVPFGENVTPQAVQEDRYSDPPPAAQQQQEAPVHFPAQQEPVPQEQPQPQGPQSGF